MKTIIRKQVSSLGILLLLIIWQLAGFFQLLPKYILPTPIEIMQAFVRDRALLWQHSLYTLQTALLGLGLGVLIACVLALIMDRYAWINEMLYTILVVIQTIPTIALAPILVLWWAMGFCLKLSSLS